MVSTRRSPRVDSSSHTENPESSPLKRKRSPLPAKPKALKRQKPNEPGDEAVVMQEPAPSSPCSPFKTPTKNTKHVDVFDSSSSPASTPSTTSKSIYARARATLRLSYTDSNARVLGRDDQRRALLNFLLPKFPELKDAHIDMQGDTPDGASGAMYISGRPGSGKTVLISDIIRNLPPSKGALLNCTTLSNIWSTLCHLLQPGLRLQGSKARSKALQLAQQLEQPFLLVLDEIDQLHPTSDLEQLYHLAASCPSLVLIGIANTLTLSATLPPSTCSLDFPPYSAADMSAIAIQRLQMLPYSVVSRPALELASRKIAAGPADLRSFLALLRRSIEQVETGSGKSSNCRSHSTVDIQEKPAEVTPKQVLTAIKLSGLSAASQPKSLVENALANAGLLQRLALISICIGLDRNLSTPLAPMTGSKAKPSPRPAIARLDSISYEDAWSAYTDSLKTAQREEFVQNRNDWESLIDSLVVCGILNADVVSTPTAASKRPSPRSKNKRSGCALSLVHGVAATVEALMLGGEAAAVTRSVWEAELRRRARRRRTWQASEEAPTGGFHGDGLEGREDSMIGGKRKSDEHREDVAWQ